MRTHISNDNFCSWSGKYHDGFHGQSLFLRRGNFLHYNNYLYHFIYELYSMTKIFDALNKFIRGTNIFLSVCFVILFLLKGYILVEEVPPSYITLKDFRNCNIFTIFRQWKSTVREKSLIQVSVSKNKYENVSLVNRLTQSFSLCWISQLTMSSNTHLSLYYPYLSFW